MVRQIFSILMMTTMMGTSCALINKKSAEAAAQSLSSGVTLSIASGDQSIDGGSIKNVKVALSCENYATEGTVTLSDLTQNIPVYGKNMNCVLKLLAFTAGSSNFAPKTGADFKTYSNGDTAIFTDGTNVVMLKVGTQLPKPLVSNATVVYLYSEVKEDKVIVDCCDISTTNIDVTAKLEKAPSLYLDQVAIAQQNSQSFLDMSFICKDDYLVVSGSASICSTAKLQNLMILVGKKPTDAINVETLNKLFISAVAVNNYLTGVVTSDKVHIRIPVTDLKAAGMNDLTECELLIALRAVSGISYRYSLVQIATTTLKSCSFTTHAGAKVTINQAEIYADHSDPRYSSTTCALAGYASYTCINGIVFGPDVPPHSVTTAGSGKGCVSQNNLPAQNSGPAQN